MDIQVISSVISSSFVKIINIIAKVSHRYCFVNKMSHSIDLIDDEMLSPHETYAMPDRRYSISVTSINRTKPNGMNSNDDNWFLSIFIHLSLLCRSIDAIVYNFLARALRDALFFIFKYHHHHRHRQCWTNFFFCLLCW